MKVSIIAIGDELLIGQVTDTNSGSLARLMAPHGWELASVRVVHDDADAIRRAIDHAMTETQVVITTGGLGPTKDDITKQVLCDYFGGTLRRDPTVTANIEEIFAKRGITMNPLTADQALVPTSCRVIQNRVGTAPIMWFERSDGHVLVAMPGVPFETIQMFQSQVLPQLIEAFPSTDHIAHRTLVVSGIPESQIALRLDRWEQAMPSFTHLAYLPNQGIVRLRLDGHHTDPTLLESEISRLHSELSHIFADNLLATDDLSPAQILISELRKAGLTVATAESCTGGTIASQITAVAGCSDVMAGGVVAYSNEVKKRILGVSPDTLEAHGAVSAETAAEMALGACRATGADCAVATTGIAGPTGGTPEKPVGTVWFGIAIHGQVTTFTHRFPGTRDRVVNRAATTALSALSMALKKLKEEGVS